MKIWATYNLKNYNYRACCSYVFNYLIANLKISAISLMIKLLNLFI